MKHFSLLFVFAMLANLAFAEQRSSNDYTNEDLEKSYKEIKASHGAKHASLWMVERLEYQSASGEEEILWDAQSWIGGDIEKLWLKTEGHYNPEHNTFGEVELQALYSKAVSPFWDVQAGIRHDIKPDPSRTFLTLSALGLAPYWFEIDAALFLSHKGDVTVRIEAEYELRITQRLILQPRLEAKAAFSSDESIEQGTGLNDLNLGLRLRYEYHRQFAPYIGIDWSESYGETAELNRINVEPNSATAIVAGLRIWL